MQMSQGVTSFLDRISARQDLVLVVVLVTTILMMILPLPTALVDFLIAINMAITVLLLMVAIYLRTPLDFSTLPAVILIATLFRLALSITTTRLILVQADAGQIVETFGQFVIAGNIIIGLVVFLIITIVQFVVITKGSERIAEVAARFSLDALPGKQMSIDSDLRNGDIDQAEAGRRRQRLEKESQLYGAMDGAMKFVKGDAIAGLVIIAVNLLGGIAVGSMQHGLSVGEAAQIYSLLTVGDGLVAQIPALFVSITAGTIVTRVTSENNRNLGADIGDQLMSDPRSPQLAAVILLVLGMVPGFPTSVFLGLALLFGGVGLFMEFRKRGQLTVEQKEAAEKLVAESMAAQGKPTINPQAEEDRIVLVLGTALHQAAAGQGLPNHLSTIRQSVADQLGIYCPSIRIMESGRAPEDGFRVEVEDVPVASGELPIDHILLTDDDDHLQLLNVEGKTFGPMLDRDQSIWIEAEHEPLFLKGGVGYLNTAEALAETVRRILLQYAARFLGLAEVQTMLSSAEQNHPALVEEVSKILPLQKVSDVFRRLLDEGISLRNLRIVLEALLDWGAREQDVVLLTEYVRSALKRQICNSYADSQKVISAYILEQDVEEMLRDAIRQTSVGGYLTLAQAQSERLIEAFHIHLQQSNAERVKPVIMTSLDLRRFLRGLLAKNDVQLPVLSYQELSSEFSIHPIATIHLSESGESFTAEAGEADREISKGLAQDPQPILAAVS